MSSFCDFAIWGLSDFKITKSPITKSQNQENTDIASLVGRPLFAQRFKRLWLQLPALLYEDFDLAFSRFEFLPARIGQTNSVLEQLERLLQRQVSAFQLFDDLFELLQALFEFWQIGVSKPIVRETLEASELRGFDAPRLYLSRNNNGANAARFLRQTIQVCAPGVSTSVCLIPLFVSHSRKWRFHSNKPSSVPHAIHSTRMSETSFAFKPANC